MPSQDELQQVSTSSIIEETENKLKQLIQDRNSIPDRMLQFFSYSHLPEHLQSVSKPFCDLAQQIVDTLPANPERTVALRKLLEAKDCAVRALLFK
jgi:hypothetical protein